MTTRDGRTLHGWVEEPKGDPGNTLSREEIVTKVVKLARFSGAAAEQVMRRSFDALWHVAAWQQVGPLLAEPNSS